MTLTQRHCVAGGQPLNPGEFAALLANASAASWTERAGALEKTFVFADFYRVMAFVNALAWIAHRENHHPDLALGYDRVTVRFGTHDAGGVTLNDFICAAHADALLTDTQ
ncbi:4a-hydroxytetrahydrobiopterin dehydratase [Paludibacterium yongneupense]|uniref:4a-hydroxytetrahydrobiopterin dehydratase n=1 Tax=Paludibacterium yongneupense TaxID=400061 RepID=UPI00040CDF96|nr:4a-hydroxytetrahydrobiopterin dehydratase [Paludibacterium yongneupense]